MYRTSKLISHCNRIITGREIGGCLQIYVCRICNIGLAGSHVNEYGAVPLEASTVACPSESPKHVTAFVYLQTH